MCGIWAIFGSDTMEACKCNSPHKILHRGPDAFRMETINSFPNCCLAFHRLVILDSLYGMQPMRTSKHPHIYLLYNGEIYNFKELQKTFGFTQDSACDGEIIIHLYAKGGVQFAAKHLDGVFFFCIVDTATNEVYLGRDTFGVRPGFRSSTIDGHLAICSEVKGLIDLPNDVGIPRDLSNLEHFPPGHTEVYTVDGMGRAFMKERKQFHKIGEESAYSTLPLSISDDVLKNIRHLLSAAVQKRLMAERRIGCLLSGGLDSSLVTALVVKLTKELDFGYKIQTFSIGMEGSTDLLAARKVSEYLDTEHHEIVFTADEGFDAVENVIYHLESYDTITIRGSVANYLISKYVKEKTDTTVMFSGEGSDEIAQGYIHFKKAPSFEEASAESERLCNDLYLFDVLRSDRTTAAWGLEVRVPFLDHRFSHYYLSLPGHMKSPKHGIEKHLLRSAFSGLDLLPDEILWRQKEGFSDGISSVSKSWHELLKDKCDQLIEDKELDEARTTYTHNPPRTKEALYYRRIFEKFYPNMGNLTPYFWMPKWTQTSDPSARTLGYYKQ